MNFDYELFREITDRFGLCMAEIRTTESSLLSSIDLTVLSSPSATDFARSLASTIGLSKETCVSYLPFMDNLTLFCLMSDMYVHDEPTSCLVASIVYFTARQDSKTVDRLAEAFKLVLGSKGGKQNRIQAHKSFVLNSLAELGTSAADIEALRRRVDLEFLQI